MLHSEETYVSILQISLHCKSINIQSKWLPGEKRFLCLTDELIESMKRSSKYARSAHVIVTPRVKRLQIVFLKKTYFSYMECMYSAGKLGECVRRALTVALEPLSLQRMFAWLQSYGKINLTLCSVVNTVLSPNTFLPFIGHCFSSLEERSKQTVNQSEETF